MAASATSPQRIAMADDRRALRKAVVDSGLVSVEMCPAGFGLMVNVSERGMAVYTMKNLASAQELQVSFMLPGSSRRIECNGMVRWSADSHAGLQLHGIDPQSLAALKRWLSTLPELLAIDNPKLQRRLFPARDEQVRAIQTHIADERLSLDDALYYMNARMLDLTGANGGAIALGKPGEMVCRASAGLAPEVGVHISSTSGVTGECIRTGKEIYCEDTELDSRVDREVCRELNLRSSLIVPVLHEAKVAGVLEAFASVPAAFQEDQRWLVKRLAEMTAAIAYEDAGERTPPPAAVIDQISEKTIEPKLPAAVSSRSAEPEQAPAVGTPLSAVLQKQKIERSFLSQIKPFWPLGTFAVSILLLSLAWHNSKSTAPATDTRPVAAPVVTPAGTPMPADEPVAPASEPIATVAKPNVHAVAFQPAKAVSRAAEDETASDSVVIDLPRANGPIEHHNDVQPATAPSVPLAATSTIPALAIPTRSDTPEFQRVATSLTGGELLHRVQPIYPALATQQGRHGDVVLRAHINKQGKVTKITSISGDPLLAGAGIAAVRQWRYEPFKRDGVPQEVDSTITLRFRPAAE